MGMYTELILGARLVKNTPKVCIDALNHVINGDENEPVSSEVKKFIEDYRLEYLFWGSSYYFGVCMPNSSFWLDHITNQWHISTRSNIKNYQNEIENFLDYLEPYIESGSGESDIYAFEIYEEDRMPKIYSLGYLEENEEEDISPLGETTR